jgi:GTP-binding protein
MLAAAFYTNCYCVGQPTETNMLIDYTKTTFLKSAQKLTDLPADTGAEVAFAGRSNAGKSSALNALTNQRKLARTSRTPGRTQLINLFTLTDDYRLVDLPGYGYAAVSEKIKEVWQATLAKYLETRDCLAGLVLLMDCRHPLKPYDLAFLEWNERAALPVHVLLTKADKLGYGAQQKCLLEVRQALKTLAPSTTVQLFSAHTGLGVEEAQAQVTALLVNRASDL